MFAPGKVSRSFIRTLSRRLCLGLNTSRSLVISAPKSVTSWCSFAGWHTNPVYLTFREFNRLPRSSSSLTLRSELSTSAIISPTTISIKNTTPAASYPQTSTIPALGEHPACDPFTLALLMDYRNVRPETR